MQEIKPDRADRAESADRPEARAAGPARDDLRARLEQLADTHPSSELFRPARDGGRDRAPADSGQQGAGGGRPPDRPAPPGAVPDAPDPARPDSPDRPISPDRERHILDGDGPGRPGGGHRAGTGKPGKTEFPKDWSDQTILSAVAGVAREPDTARMQPNGRLLSSGERDGVRVHVVSLRDGQIWAAWPEPGGRGVRQNPKDGSA